MRHRRAERNAAAGVDLLAPHVARVSVANPLPVHRIAKAKTKTDKIDAGVLAPLYAAGFLPEAWVPDEATLARRRQVTRRTQLAKRRARLKSVVQSILHAHLIPRCPHADLLGIKGRARPRAQNLTDDEREAVERHVDGCDRAWMPFCLAGVILGRLAGSSIGRASGLRVWAW